MEINKHSACEGIFICGFTTGELQLLVYSSIKPISQHGCYFNCYCIFNCEWLPGTSCLLLFSPQLAAFFQKYTPRSMTNITSSRSYHRLISVHLLFRSRAEGKTFCGVASCFPVINPCGLSAKRKGVSKREWGKWWMRPKW